MDDLTRKLWVVRTRALVEAHNGTWRPCVCIQGGGAKGAWEAGVLAGLLENSSTANPVAIFGTSAGALNAMWASTLKSETAPRKLLDNWISLAMIFTSAIIHVPAILFSLFIAAIVSARYPSICAFSIAWFLAFTLWTFTAVVMIEVFAATGLIVAGICSCIVATITLFGLGHEWWEALLPIFVPVFILIRYFHFRWRYPQHRLPALFPVAWLGHLLALPEGPAQFNIFLCTADVNVRQIPVKWEWNTLGIFRLREAETEPILFNQFRYVRYDLRTVAMCSAALPILCQPYEVGQKKFLDGGLAANLPAGFVFEQGLLGGRCMICIIPQPLEKLNPADHVQYRTLRFLHDLKAEQASHRNRIALKSPGVASTQPAHTQLPILIVSPSEILESGFIDGFLQHHVLTQEFDSGRETALQLTRAMSAFLQGSDRELDRYLLDQKLLPALPPTIPRPGIWALWANPNWFA